LRVLAVYEDVYHHSESRGDPVRLAARGEVWHQIGVNTQRRGIAFDYIKNGADAGLWQRLLPQCVRGCTTKDELDVEASTILFRSLFLII
jgi:hypothetical protein